MTLQVSWVRHRDVHLLTIGRYTYTNDQRFRVIHPAQSEDWTLQIKYPQHRDSGIYECQVSTTPHMSHLVHLSVIGKLRWSTTVGHRYNQSHGQQRDRTNNTGGTLCDKCWLFCPTSANSHLRRTFGRNTRIRCPNLIVASQFWKKKREKMRWNCVGERYQSYVYATNCMFWTTIGLKSAPRATRASTSCDIIAKLAKTSAVPYFTRAMVEQSVKGCKAGASHTYGY